VLREEQNSQRTSSWEWTRGRAKRDKRMSRNQATEKNMKGVKIGE
jgi:hypothetical protein